MKNMIQALVFAEVKAERDYQDKLWNTAVRTDATAETDESFLAYINEYANSKVVRGKERTFRERMIKVAALAIAAIERIDVVNAAASPAFPLSQPRVYISSHSRAEARVEAEMLRVAGYDVVSTWHDMNDALPVAFADRAKMNFEQIDRCDIYIGIIAEGRVTGGKFVEQGYAFAKGKRCYLLTMPGRAEPENVASFHPGFKLIDGTEGEIL